MSQQANKFKLGLFVIAGSLLLILILILVGMRSLFEEGVMVETACDTSVQGLDVGSPVKFRGVNIGVVREIGFVWENYTEISEGTRPFIIIRMEIDKEFITQSIRGVRFVDRLENSVQNGLRVQLTSQGLTGLSYMEVDVLDPERYPPPDISWEPDYPYIPSAPGRIATIADSMEIVATKMEKIDIDGIAVEFNKLLRDTNTKINELEIQKLSRETSEALVEIRGTSAKIRSLLEQPGVEEAPQTIATAISDLGETIRTTKERAPQVMDDLSTATTEVRGAAQDLRELLASKPIASGIESFSQTAQNAEVASEDMKQTLERINNTLLKVELLLSEEQQNFHEVMDNLSRASRNLDETTTMIKRYPSLLLFSGPPEKVEEQKK